VQGAETSKSWALLAQESTVAALAGSAVAGVVQAITVVAAIARRSQLKSTTMANRYIVVVISMV
jgi:hypothetical protein